MHDLRDLLKKFHQTDSITDLKKYNSDKTYRERLDKLNLDAKPAVLNDIWSRIGQERLLGKNNLMEVSYLSKGMQLSKSVCRIIHTSDAQSSASHKNALGSGFLVGAHILMTNNHVVDTRFSASLYFAEFDYENDPTGKLKSSFLFRLDPEKFFVTHKELDYTLVGVSTLASNDVKKNVSDFGYVDLTSSQGKIIIGEAVSIIQHPEGLPKMIAIRDNLVLNMEPPYIRYATDTQRGSSGSLVANDQWDIVALHHAAVPNKNEQGQIILKKGGIWQGEKDNEFIDWIANEGVLMDYILADLKSRIFNNQQHEEIRHHILRNFTPEAEENDFKLPV